MTAAKGWPRPMPPGADATAYAVEIQRHVAPRDWPAALAYVPEPMREAAETYLRGIAERMRTKRAARVRGTVAA